MNGDTIIVSLEDSKAELKRFNEDMQRLYEGDAELRILADKLHHSRMMDGPACAKCIESVARQMGLL